VSVDEVFLGQQVQPKLVEAVHPEKVKED